jgi:hypothetical protein
MIFMRILPGVLKELLKHVPTVLFQVVEWNELMSELPKLSRRILQKEGYQQIFDHHSSFLSPFNLKLTQTSLTDESYQVTKWSAEKCLHLYFAQIFSPHGLFLDLRSQNFSAHRPELKWHPTGLWTILDEDFREGLLEVYEGFYLQNNELYFQGLERIGLIADDWTEQDRNRLGDLFRAQFGSALTTEMSFDLEHFRSSIVKLTDFLLKKKVKITKDFLYLGIYLVTLYSHLEQSHEKLAVRDIYLKVREQYS